MPPRPRRARRVIREAERNGTIIEYLAVQKCIIFIDYVATGYIVKSKTRFVKGRQFWNTISVGVHLGGRIKVNEGWG